MKAIGLDIGTTTICAVLIDAQTGAQLDKHTVSNNTSVSAPNAYEKLQDPKKIERSCLELLEKLAAGRSDIDCIGVTGQMHGIVYLDSTGQPVSELITWQDGRGNLMESDCLTYARKLSSCTGVRLASGYGSVTHYWNTRNNKIPENAVTMCTIADYIAMRLAHRKTPLLHSSMAASIGLFSMEKNAFDRDAISRAGMDPVFFPPVQDREDSIGYWKQNVKVSAAFGDNQASFLGAVESDGKVLVNVGTGSQISILGEENRSFSQLECRPFMNGKYLYVGSSLCGGYAYALLKQFFESVLALCDIQPFDGMYERMNAAAGAALEHGCAEKPLADVRFNGSRAQPSVRGKIENISPENFYAGEVTLAVLQGICKELYDFYLEANMRSDVPYITGSGNGIRKNPLLQKLFSLQFGKTIRISKFEEEAAYGSALFALHEIKNQQEEVQ